MKTISEQYREQNALAHQANDGYGARGYKHLKAVLRVAERLDATSALDYGCGQGTLGAHAKRMTDIPFASYDPAVPQFAADPEPADLVVCTDVMEHVEPAYLHNVLDHIMQLARKGVYFEIACREALRTLPDGRNAHILIQPPEFWFQAISQYFTVLEYLAAPGHSVVIVARARENE